VQKINDNGKRSASKQEIIKMKIFDA
jgi:hypothetical protein